ncbi:MAG: protein kinase [bacterium]|nr:protein kinase [bacterium]
MTAVAPDPSGTVTLTTLLLTDLVDSTRLVETLGDEKASEVWARHDNRARELLAEFGGQEIDKSDGFLLLFKRPIDAVRFALAYHLGLTALSEQLGVDLQARCGIHLGEVFLRENLPQDVARGAKAVEVEGLAKPAAARVMSLGTGGQTLLTRAAFDLARRAAVGDRPGGQPLRWLAHGPYLFKGVPEPQEIFEVGEVGVAPLSEPADTDKARRAVSPADEDTLGWRPAPAQPVPRRPHWTLTEKLGEGGFGEVWLAEHQKTHEKRVFKFCFEAERLRALKREVTLFRLLREALGHRDDIARILDWDFEEVPYLLESEHTEGGSLIEWSEQQEGIDRVPFETRLELVAQVAEALAAAHSVGVLHKDVKPGNVLIQSDRRGEPRAVLTDFGIGLITDRDLLEQRGITSLGLTGMTVGSSESSSGGTQMYMAPELLAGGAPSIQADVYALGVVLYQMAVGDLERPLAPGWRREIEDEILREDIASFVDGSPDRRPRSALEVAERLRSLDERRTSREADRRARERSEKSRRLRKVLTVVTAVSTVFLVIVSLLALQAVRARGEAERERRQAERLIDYMLFDLRDSLEAIGRLDLLEGVSRSTREYFKIRSTSRESVDASYQRGLTHLYIGDVLLDQGDTEAALESYRVSDRLFDELLTRNSGNDRWREGWSRSQIKLGGVYRRQGDLSAAYGAYRSALEVEEQLTVGGEQATNERRFALAQARYLVGWAQGQRGEVAIALEMLTSAQEAVEEIVSEEEETPWRYWLLALDIRSAIGTIWWKKGENSAALDSFLTTRVLCQQLAKREPANTIWPAKRALVDHYIGSLRRREGDLPAALEAFGGSMAAYRLLSERDPMRIKWRAGVAQSQHAIARIHLQRGDLPAALDLHAESLEIFTELVARDPTRLTWQTWSAAALGSIATIHRRRGDWPAELQSLLEARPLLEHQAEIERDDPVAQRKLGGNRLAVGRTHRQMGRLEEAHREWRQCLEIAEAGRARGDSLRWRKFHAKTLLYLGRVDEARPLVDELLKAGESDPEFLALVSEHGLDQFAKVIP